jgi:RND family efflux transporter MFP subunit
MARLRIKIILLFAIPVVLAALLGFVFSFEKPVLVEAAEVGFGDLEEIVEMSGNIDSEDTETIISNTEGIIANLTVEEGDEVRLGQRLCVIRSPQLRQKLLGMKAELITARANINAASSRSGRELARARYNFVRANIADIEETMRPKAHIKGEVIKVDIQNGAKIIPGMSLISIADVERPVLKARMDESDIQKVRAGQPIWVSGDFLGGASLQGKVSRVSGFVRRDGGTYVETTCKIFNPKNMVLTFGAYADVKVITARRKDVLMIPKEALIMEKGAHVFVVKNKRARLTPIDIGIIGEKYVEVLSGIKEGERVATVGSLDLSHGEKVKIK